ncbi:hypothetical protein BGZ97_011050 [Linnemannia gamsii]|uniref:HMG box domain-containing protein n=1 Tax=Linnemannia gamsii TaxID=64522 RepID=A0A9P6UVI9_9FUNG|nr:hypothetical protein BGZ97_011050 [Linnemannia gamsii]
MPSYSHELKDSYNSSATSAFWQSMASSPQTSQTSSTFSNYNDDMPIKSEVGETIMASSFLISCTEDNALRAPYVGQVKGHSLGLHDNIQSNPCFSSALLPREGAFDTSSFTNLLSNSELYSQEQQDAGFNEQRTSLEHASQHPHQDLLSFKISEDVESASATSYPRRSDKHSLLLLTRASSRLRNLRMGDHGLNTQEDCDEEEMQRDYRESRVASAVTRRFSGLSLMSVVSSPLFQTAPASVTTPATIATIFPITTTATISSTAASAVYFPPTASALHQKRRKALKQELRVPRPKNCFMLYRSKVLPMIMAELGNINNKIISKIAAERWRAESEPVKTWYRNMAKYGKEEHARNNPGYKYAPLNKMRTIAATAISHLIQAQHPIKTATASNDSEEVDMDEGDKAGDEDYVGGTSSSRRRSVRQRQQRQQSITRSSLRSQASKRRNSNHGSENPLSLRNKKPRDRLENHVSYPTLNFSADSFSSLGSTETATFPMFEQQQQQYQECFQTRPFTGPSRPLPALPYGASSSAATASATTSIYGLADDKNASEVTLVDPFDHWTAHRYQEAPSYFDPTRLSPVSTNLLSPNSGVQKSKLAAASLTNSNNSDPSSILAQMFLDYNPYSHLHAQQQQHHHRQYYQHHQHQHQLSTSSSCSTTTTFRTTESSFSTMKEPKMSTVGIMNMGAIHHVQQQHTHEQNPFQHAFQQHTQQQLQAFQKHTTHQRHQQQQRSQQYFQQQGGPMFVADIDMFSSPLLLK